MAYNASFDMVEEGSNGAQSKTIRTTTDVAYVGGSSEKKSFVGEENYRNLRLLFFCPN